MAPTVTAPAARAAKSEHVIGGRICGSQPGNYARARDLGPDLTHRKLVERIATSSAIESRERSATIETYRA